MNLPVPSTCALAIAIAGLPAQSPSFTMTPAVGIGAGSASLQWQLEGPIPTPHAVLMSLYGGPSDFMGATLLLGYPYSPTIVHFAMSSAGATNGAIVVPGNAALAGATLFGQPVVIDPQAANGLFRVGTGASTVIHSASHAIALDFTDPVASGFQGNFRDDIAGHVRGGVVLHRTQDTLSPSGALFGQPIQSPLNPQGCREQMVFRAVDLAATGEPELVTAVRWLALGQVVPDTFLQFELRMGHSHVVPDYSVDPFSALAIAPGSGLSSLFANNEIPTQPPVTVALGRYDVDPSTATWSWPGLFVPYPAIAPFRYDGASSLLLDFRVTQGLLGVNGQQVQLMVQSGPMPAARAVASGTWQAPMPLPNPGQATQANILDCAMPVLQFDFARVETHAQSPWLNSGLANPDYHAAIVAASNRPGTSVEVRYRGSFGGNATGATAWSTNPDIADGMQYLQIDVRLIGNPLSDEVPILDTLVVPIN